MTVLRSITPQANDAEVVRLWFTVCRYIPRITPLTGEYGAKRRLETAFAVLNSEDRIIVTLAELEGWKIAEIAELDARSEGQIKMRLSRARSKMRPQLIRMYPDLARNLKESPGRTSV